MRRTALLLAAPVLAAGLLAGCDLPGGSPKILGPDQMPNDQPSEAPLVHVPAAINGTVDNNDQVDFYRLNAPQPPDPGLSVTCTGDVAVQASAGLINVSQIGVDIPCDGQPHVIGVDAEAEPIIAVFHTSGNQLDPYLVTVSYVPRPGI
jgi:hypothetical protein